MRVLLALAMLVVGALSAVATIAVHGHWWGLALATAAVLTTLVAVGRGWTTRLPFALGFDPVVLRSSVPRPEGDYLVAADPQGYLMLGLTLVVTLVALATLPRPGRERRRDRPAAPT